MTIAKSSAERIKREGLGILAQPHGTICLSSALPVRGAETVTNIKTAETLGFDMPDELLALADAVIRTGLTSVAMRESGCWPN